MQVIRAYDRGEHRGGADVTGKNADESTRTHFVLAMKDKWADCAENSGENTESRCPDSLKPYRWQKGQPSPNPGGRPKKAFISEAYVDLIE